MGFGLWIDVEQGLAWAQGTHEYRPMGAAVISWTDQFRPRDFQRPLRFPRALRDSFAGFFGSLEEVNEYLRSSPAARRSRPDWMLRPTPLHVR
jgi:hypothetical protein